MNTVEHILDEIDQNLDGSLTLTIVRSWDQDQIFPRAYTLEYRRSGSVAQYLSEHTTVH